VKFIDIDESFSISTSASPIKGWIAARAPKGNTEAQYFSPGSASAIDAMCGLGTAHWPDLLEAKAFNNEYGLYISSPPGSSEEYPSKTGGCYITKTGVYKFYDVNQVDGDDLSTVNFYADISPGDESIQYNTKVRNSIIRLANSTDTGAVVGKDIIIDNIDPVIFSKLNTFDIALAKNGMYLAAIGNSSARPSIKAGTYEFVINQGQVLISYGKDDDRIIGITGEGSEIGTKKIVLYAIGNGNGSDIPNTKSYFKFNDSAYGRGLFFPQVTWFPDSATPPTPINTATNKPEFGWAYRSTLTDPAKYLYYVGGTDNSELGIANGWQDLSKVFPDKAIAGTLKSIGNDYLTNDIHFKLNIKEETYAILYQKSATEKQTALTISQIGYDKYHYDYSLQAFFYKPEQEEELFGLGDYSEPGRDLARYVTNTDGYLIGIPMENISTFTGNYSSLELKLWKYDSTVEAWSNQTANKNTIITRIQNLMGNYSYDFDGLFSDLGEVLYANYETSESKSLDQDQGLYIEGKSVVRDAQDNPIRGTPDGIDDDLVIVNQDIYKSSFLQYFKDTLWIIDSGEMHIQQEDGDYPFKPNLKFNSFTFSTSEEVYPGSKTGGGVFTGSLSETGVDSYGAKIYFGNILADDDMSFVALRVLKTFDDPRDTDSFNNSGIWQGSRILAPLEPNGMSTYLTNLSGDRYVDYVCTKNIELGVPGGTWVNEYYGIINEALNEALKPVYDDSYIFFEPTGQEIYKAQLAAIRKAQELATVVSPKIINPIDVVRDDSPEGVIVSGRMKGTAQYVGEFMQLDPYTAKKYWVCPIGDVALNLARIMDKKLGGWAPMWYNITGGLGGQLTRSVLKARFNFTDRQTEIFDQKGLNPIVFTADEGLMMVSQKTTESPDAPTDWSYLGHSMSFDLCKREIRDNVMRQQIGKPNSPYWQNLRKAQVDAILQKRTTGSQPIWSSGTCDIAGVNTPQVMAQRKFAILVKVRVYVFSETVELTFVNQSQT
jgi:hypothetical protein